MSRRLPAEPCLHRVSRAAGLAAGTGLVLATAGSALAELPATGEVLWTFDLSHVSGAFIDVGPDGVIYTADSDRLWAIHPDGTEKWRFDDAGGAGGLSAAGHPVAVLPGGRIIASAGHTIWALEPDGSVAWDFTWSGGYNNQIDNGPSLGPDGHLYATTAVNDGAGMGVFSLTAEGTLRWDDRPPLFIINQSHGQRIRFIDDRLVFGFIATSGAPSVYAHDFAGNPTNLVDYTCTSSPKTDGVDRLLLAGACGIKAIDLDSDEIIWSVGLGAVNMLPITDADGMVYSASWHGPMSRIDRTGSVVWTSEPAGVQRTLAVNDAHGLVLYGGESFGDPNWLGAIDADTGAIRWELPFATVDGHNELIWSNEAAFSPDGTVAYFTTRFTSNGAPGRLWAVRIADAAAPCVGDVDASAGVGLPDLLDLLTAWGPCPNCGADLDGDGAVGVSDLVMMLANWGPCV